MCFFLVTISNTTQAFQKSDWCTHILRTILWLQDHNSRYSKDLIENSLSFLKGIDENKRHVELETLSKYPCRLGAVERSFQQPLQNACRNLSKEGLKMKFDPMLTENTNNVQVAPTTGIGKTIEVVNCAMKKVNYIVVKYFRKPRKVNFLYQSHNFDTTIEIELSISDPNL